MARSRDYAAEYARRIARGEAAGLSRSSARGHARTGEPTAGFASAIRGAVEARATPLGGDRYVVRVYDRQLRVREFQMSRSHLKRAAKVVEQASGKRRGRRKGPEVGIELDYGSP